MSRLYYIENMGCDDVTRGLVRISDEDFPKFKSFIENLNKNSYYGCMPTIAVYNIGPDDVHLKTYADDCNDDYLYLDDNIYVANWEYIHGEMERVV